MNPIVSRFCEIYVPETLDPLTGNVTNLHRKRLCSIYEPQIVDTTWWSRHLQPPLGNLLHVVHDAYEAGKSSLDLMDWIRKDCNRVDVVMYFHHIKSEYRCEKMLMFCILAKLFQSPASIEKVA